MGLAITREAARRGHEVSVFHRGVTAVGSLDGVHHIIGDRDMDLSALADTSLSWDVTIDVCGYRPHQIDALAAVLGSRAGLYVYVSTVSVYADETPVHSDEINGTMVSMVPLDGEDTTSVPIGGKTYGPLKLLCELRAQALYKDLLIIRPTYVVGPEDYTMRFPKWVQRISAGGTVDCPNPPSIPMQYIDARDQAAFVVDLIDRGMIGVFNCCVTPEITFGEMIDCIVKTVGAPDVSINWVDVNEDSTDLAASFPLWSGREGTAMMTMDATAAVSNGLTFRPLSETVTDTLRWLQQKEH